MIEMMREMANNGLKDAVPPEAIAGAWKVDANGNIIPGSRVGWADGSIVCPRGTNLRSAAGIANPVRLWFCVEWADSKVKCNTPEALAKL